eukprot:15484646-Alexandrium_andersonii.AAC.1
MGRWSCGAGGERGCRFRRCGGERAEGLEHREAELAGVGRRQVWCGGGGCVPEWGKRDRGGDGRDGVVECGWC